MLTAQEARAVSALVTPEDYSIHKHIEIRIWDSIQTGGSTSFIYAGDMTDNVIKALQALGYTVIPMQFEDEIKMYRISWEDLKK